jgi:hypothetical protein
VLSARHCASGFSGGETEFVVGASSAGTNRVTLKSSMSATRIFPGRFVDFRGDARGFYASPSKYFSLVPEEFLTVK